jgi:lysozyme
MCGVNMAQRDICQKAIDLIKKYEGICDGDSTTVNIDPYLDPVNIWTIGWGHAINYQHRFLRGEADHVLAKTLYPQGITLAQAETLLHADLINAGRDVLSIVTVNLRREHNLIG